MAGVVHRDDRAGAECDRRRDLRRVDRQRVRFHIDQHRSGAHMLDDVDGRSERQRRRDHFVARPDPTRDECGVEPGRAGVQREGRLGRDRRCELGFEAGDLGAGGDPVGAQGVDDLGDLLLADKGGRKRE